MGRARRKNHQAAPGKLASCVVDCGAVKETPTATGSRTSVIDSPTLTLLRLSSHISMLNASQSTTANIVDSGDELFVLRSGQLEATVNGITSRINEGSFFNGAPNDKRTIRNTGASPSADQVIKVVSANTPK